MKLDPWGNYINKKGKIVHFGALGFKERILNKKACFICGALENSFKKFNEEHVIPKWILKQAGEYNRIVGLTNDTSFRMGQYRVPICMDCNADLSKTFEKPISQWFKLSYGEFFKMVNSKMENRLLLFQWLCLLHFKLFYKDIFLKANLENQSSKETIGDKYNWEKLRFIHAIARSHYTEVEIDPNIIGTIIILPVIEHNKLDKFSYATQHSWPSVMVHLNDISIVAMLTNANVANLSYWHDELLSRIKAPLSHQQIIEIMAYLNYENSRLEEHPTMFFSPEGRISVKRPERLQLVEQEVVSFEELFYKLLEWQPKQNKSDPKTKDMIRRVRNGEIGFLFDEEGNFIDHSKHV